MRDTSGATRRSWARRTDHEREPKDFQRWLNENRKQKKAPARGDEEVVEEAPATTERGEKLKADIDDLLDEIDEVLEENSEDFVRSYVQKGGQ